MLHSPGILPVFKAQATIIGGPISLEPISPQKKTTAVFVWAGLVELEPSRKDKWMDGWRQGLTNFEIHQCQVWLKFRANSWPLLSVSASSYPGQCLFSWLGGVLASFDKTSLLKDLFGKKKLHQFAAVQQMPHPWTSWNTHMSLVGALNPFETN